MAWCLVKRRDSFTVSLKLLYRLTRDFAISNFKTLSRRVKGPLGGGLIPMLRTRFNPTIPIYRWHRTALVHKITEHEMRGYPQRSQRQTKTV